MAPDVLDLGGPPPSFHAEGLVAALGRDAVEAGLDDGELRPAVRVREPELDQRGVSAE
jgi:hypothetical protein